MSENVLLNGLLVPPEPREVIMPDMDDTIFLEVYNVPHMAEALGKSYFTIRRWVSVGMIPKGIILSSGRAFPQYTPEEVEVVRSVLLTHHQDFYYLTLSNEVAVNQIWQGFEGVRKAWADDIRYKPTGI